MAESLVFAFYFMELWRFISGFENLYEISSTGRIRSLPKRASPGIKILSQRLKKGYLHVHLSKNGKDKEFPVHRLVAIAFIENKYDKPCVNHINGIKEDNNASNLEWVTITENNLHARNNGLSRKVYPGTRPNYNINPFQEKRVFQYTKLGEFIASFQSRETAGLANNVTGDAIAAALDNPFKSAAGFIWKSYADVHVYSI